MRNKFLKTKEKKNKKRWRKCNKRKKNGWNLPKNAWKVPKTVEGNIIGPGHSKQYGRQAVDQSSNKCDIAFIGQ